MSPRKGSNSSSSEDDRYANMDERKRKRMISNRESARRSRMKREQHVKNLNDQIFYFRAKNQEMFLKINEMEQRCMPMDSENRVLRAQGEELRKRLESLEMMSSYLNEYSGSLFQDPWIKPWQPLVQYQPVMTSAGDLHY